ncbi:hypothetical protein KAFR_0K01890 [Kazachstania africana CBS 2517]|uniref:Uncharacterized protein n=1 Tax=Kazachstania africana (strain ATCC 22294 / BCRC 22015 / CBS 2517 / CECT 1963 / NBRC 1671 / NRRL Y-8276) TaxID=1071382 RepID=H2B1P3_KAZAF|nr:hypothetical protein KAFR_0K01890 [Kazachstania africana CBS 2517]CCF60543.1 hypothetical protein KAFR_0K01890 [Kazachstania africana CBS 2517]
MKDHTNKYRAMKVKKRSSNGGPLHTIDNNVPVKKRNLSNKNSLILQEFEEKQSDDDCVPARLDSDMAEYQKLQELQYLQNSMQDANVSSHGTNILPLNKRTLKQLQTQIFQLETSKFDCSHFLCSKANMETIEFSRLWFLFELEMSYDGKINLRNDCYYNKVYFTLDNHWEQSNCLALEHNKGYPIIPLAQLLIPKLDFEPSRIDDLDVYMETVIDNSLLAPRKKKIPPTLLFQRNVIDIFEDVPPIDTKNILRNDSTSFTSSTKSENDQKNINKEFLNSRKVRYFE